MNDKYQCGFCYPSEHGTRGEVKREWSVEWTMFIPLCRLHAEKNEKLNEELIAKMPQSKPCAVDRASQSD